jgi:hypothetical protein
MMMMLEYVKRRGMNVKSEEKREPYEDLLVCTQI